MIAELMRWPPESTSPRNDSACEATMRWPATRSSTRRDLGVAGDTGGGQPEHAVVGVVEATHVRGVARPGPHLGHPRALAGEERGVVGRCRPAAHEAMPVSDG
jgi:hypothetical protein